MQKIIVVIIVVLAAIPASTSAGQTAAATSAEATAGQLLSRQQMLGQKLRVCPKPQGPQCQFLDLAAAAAMAGPGSEIVLAPGVYDQGAVLQADGLILRGEPGAHLKGHPVQGKAALVVTGARVVIEGIECSGIAVPDKNGACIRIEGDDLTVRNVYFHDNEQGILSGPGRGTVLVENSRFERNGYGGQAHGIYIGQTVDRFIFRGNVVLSTHDEGHGVKSRARETLIENNVIAGLDGNDSRAIDLPNGGKAVIRRNILEKGPRSVNWQMIGLALEKPIHSYNETIIEQNLIIFDPPKAQLIELLAKALNVKPKRGTVVFSKSPGPVVLQSNVIIGARELGVNAPGGSNTSFRMRQDAGLPAYPDVSASLLKQVQRLR